MTTATARVRIMLATSAIVFATQSRGAASAVVVLATPDRIVIGADSRQDNAPTRDAITRDSACKIWLHQNAVFAVAGDVKGPTYDVREVAPLAIRRDGGAAARLFWTVEQLRRREQSRGTPDALVNIVLASLDPEGVALAIAQMRIPSGYPERTFLCRQQCLTVLAFRPTSTSLDLSSTRHLLQNRPSASSMVRFVDTAIGQQSADTPEAVGGPVDIAVVDKDGARWHRVKSNCLSAN